MYPYYTDTAYNSAKQYELPPADNITLKYGSRVVRRNPLGLPPGVHCQEYLAQSNIGPEMDFLTSDNPRWQSERDKNVHQEWSWQTFSNPRSFLRAFTTVFGYFSLIGVGVMLFCVFFTGVTRSWIIASFLTVLFPVFIYLLGKILLRFNLVKDKGDIVFNRQTGMVMAYCKGERKAYPFVEFDPFYIAGTPNPNGSVDFHLHLGHRYSDAAAHHPENFVETWGPNLAWEFLCQYMDVSKPLPEVPLFEHVRAKDPTTAEYDRRHGRPDDYWRNMVMRRVEILQEQAFQAVKTYPWGQTRDQALKNGWQKSKCGPDDYARELQRRELKRLKDHNQAQEAEAVSA